MKIIVCGAGQVGGQIALRLSQEGHSVTVIDLDPDLIQRMTDRLDVSGVVGHAAHPDVQERAGAVDAEMLIAATQIDEVNMIACQVAHSEFNVPQKIARVRAKGYLENRWSDLFRRDHMPIDVIISPENEVAKVAVSRLRKPAAFDMSSYFDGAVSIVAITLPPDCAVLNTPLRQLTELFSTLSAQVLAVRREGRLQIADANDQLLAGDQIHVLSTAADLDRTIAIFVGERKAVRNVVLIGAGNVGLEVAELLEQTAPDIRLRMIERDRVRAEYAADRLNDAIMLNGDGLDADILEEARVGAAEAVITLTDDDRANLLSAALCKQAGCALTIALVKDTVLANLAERIGVDITLNPRATTVSTILRHVRRGRVRAVHVIGEGEAEIVEAQILSTSPIAGKRIRDAGFPDDSVVGAVLSDGKVKLPHGDLTINADDRVVVFVLSKRVREIEQMFRVSVEFF
ncbi:Trk system potassium transporter TrkA [Pikeienuella piscinae]|uniref:Trk system potassium uptake protein TrkA n=1 Tax=Pikeienuella piscinae TaxID=2748098 RepID=A0A7L5BT68_9RHOB|nr:Trk system potassium transporter TrkA [Pikeienuella piscinae]QIE54462.1 Trk system potassium transporter TrkA [Pikeienuella piscinae]